MFMFDRKRKRQDTRAPQSEQTERARRPSRRVKRRTASNQHLQRQLRERGIQAKLTVNEPDDKYEKEAEPVAEVVMQLPVPTTSVEVRENAPRDRTWRMCSRCQRRYRQGKSLDCPECEEKLRRKEASLEAPAVHGEMEQQIQLLRGRGKPLPDSVRSFFEPRFGADFSDVRVYAGRQADKVAQAVNARAFTMDRDVVFGRGEYAPDSKRGRALIAHELTHVVQQRQEQTTSDQPIQRRIEEDVEIEILGQARSFLPYQVEPGDTLSDIASRFDVAGGWREIYDFEFNQQRIDDPHAIYPGEWVAIPYESIRDYTEAQEYEADIESNWGDIQSMERSPTATDQEGEQRRYPRLRRVELSVDPEPRTVITINPGSDPRGPARQRERGPTASEVDPSDVTDLDIILHKLREGDEQMKAALDYSIGVRAREELRECAKDIFCWLTRGKGGGLSEEEGDELQRGVALENYRDRTGKSRDQLVEEYIRSLPEETEEPTTHNERLESNPEQTLYFEFDSTALNQELTTDKDWQNIVDEVAKYITMVHRYPFIFDGEEPSIAVEGYASPVGQESYNEGLSFRRAVKVQNDLMAALEQRDDLADLDYVVWAAGRGEHEPSLVIY